jgi:hypothetical protein
MSRILLLEDRPSRQNNSLPNGISDINTLKSMNDLIMPEGDFCKKIINDINEQVYKFVSGIELIMIHRSSLSAAGLKYLDNYCIKNNSALILFSGGTSEAIYNDDEFRLLSLNSADFYTERLIPFIEKFFLSSDTHLLELIQSNWRVSYLLKLRHLIKVRELIKTCENKNQPESDTEVSNPELEDYQIKIDQLLEQMNIAKSDEMPNNLNYIIKKELLKS